MVILETISVPVAGVALVLGVDRLLDMMRTTTNITGDAAVAAYIAATSDAERQESDRRASRSGARS